MNDNFKRMNERQINAQMWADIRRGGAAMVVAGAFFALVVCAWGAML